MAGNYFDNIVKNLEEKISKEKREFKIKVRDYLKKIQYEEMSEEEKINFLLTSNGLKIIKTASSPPRNFSLVEISNMLKFSLNRFVVIKRENPIIEDYISLGTAEKDTELEENMYKIANGFEYEEIKETESGNTNSDRKIKKVEKTKRYIPPNFNANRYLLEAKRKKEFEQKQIELAEEGNKFKIVIKFNDGGLDEDC